MPNYKYKCSECGHEFSVFQAMSDPDITECPKCSGNVKKLLSGGAGVIYKGDGFYVNDYNPAKKQDAKKDHSSCCSSAGGCSCNKS